MTRADKGQDLAERIRDDLRRRGCPASSRWLVERFLRSTAPSEEFATRLLRPLLEPAGLIYREASGWSLPRISAPVAGPAEDAGAAGPATGFAAAVPDRGAGNLFVAPVGAAAPIEPGSVRWQETTLVVLDRRADPGWIRDWLRGRGLGPPRGIVALRRLARGVVRLGRHAGLEEICAALGVRWLDTQDAAGEAVAMAACLAEIVARRGPRGVDRREEIEPPLDLPAGFGAEDLAAIPDLPGVYRFYDRQGGLLYVGKAKSLRRRIRGYFSRRRPEGHGARFLEQVHRLEYDLLDSELEALLEEARQIAGRGPRENVQHEVHERRHPGLHPGSSRCFALLLPAPSGGRVTAILIREGRYLGHLRIGPRGGGLATAHRLIGRAVSGPSPRPRPGGADRETEILERWLARHGDAVSRLDLEDCTRVSEAAEALKRAAQRLAGETEPVSYYR